ncbi:biotin/lipoyl-binding protein [Mucilaginibacter sp. P25]|uniref:biotin/lipoyl-binding protein n=1 Tax=Mucilaginibacter sp. P25 TaxID=3423945 RepID=UPI003D7B0494
MDASPDTPKVKWMAAMLIIMLVALLLPWTQNVRSKGNVSTLEPQQRPQQVNTMIAGRIAKWYVRDGAMVKQGDTLLQITETKDEIPGSGTYPADFRTTSC